MPVSKDLFCQNSNACEVTGPIFVKNANMVMLHTKLQVHFPLVLEKFYGVSPGPR